MVRRDMRLLKAIPRLIRAVLAIAITLLVLSVIASGALLYLSVTGKNLVALRTIVGGAGKLLAGQRTDALVLRVRAVPESASFSGSADLTVRSIENGRRRFFFLLNEGFALTAARAGTGDGGAPLTAYRLGPLVVVELATPVAADEQRTVHLDYQGQPSPGLLGAGFVFEPGYIRLPVDSFWYPNDVQSSMTADVTVSIARELTLVHNGEVQSEVERGALRSTRWTTARPVPGMALIAGRYEETGIEANGVRYRLFLPPGERLDGNRVLALTVEADRILRSKLGPSGFPQVTAVVTDRVRRAFNDGSGLLVLSDRYFRRGDYGFGLLAHELAHNWWGSTVAEKWLTPGTGGEWIVEGFAELSSIIATEEKYGEAALTLRLTEAFFDPARQRSVADMSVLDNSLAEDVSRDTIYRKGAYVAFMLRQVVGADKFYESVTEFLARFRYQQASDVDVQRTFEEVTGLDLEPFFEDWVRSDRFADLAIETTKDDRLEITNYGSARVSGEIELWKLRPDGSLYEATRVRVGDRIDIDPAADHLILDPQLHWADVERGNNRFPQQSFPSQVAVSSSGRVLVTYGEPFRWARTTVRETTVDLGATATTWDFNRGFAQPFAFARGGEIAVGAYSEADNATPSVVSLAPNGSRKTLGPGSAPGISTEGRIFAVSGNRIVELVDADAVEPKTIVARPHELAEPRPSPDGRTLAYTARQGNAFDLRLRDFEDRSDRVLLSWQGDTPHYTWSADGEQLYVAVGVGWDWQIWAVPTDASLEVARLVTDAVGIGEVALSPDGELLAFTAVPYFEYPLNRHRLYVQPLQGGVVQTFDLGGDVYSIAWRDSQTLFAVTRLLAPDNAWILPASRVLQQINLAAAVFEPLP